jgi:hypothetical protein
LGRQPIADGRGDVVLAMSHVKPGWNADRKPGVRSVDQPRKEPPMADDDVFGRINALSDEEEHLYEHAGDGHGLTAAYN